MNAQTETKLPAPLMAGGIVTAIIPQSLEEMWRISTMVIQAGIAPKALVDKKSGIHSFADLKGKKVGAQAQTTGEDYAKSEGLDPVSFESSDAVLNGLRTGQVKAVIIDYPVVQGWLKDKANADAFKVVDNLNTGEQYGFTVKKGNAKLVAAINKALADAKADGTYKTLYEKWIGPYDASAASPSAS